MIDTTGGAGDLDRFMSVQQNNSLFDLKDEDRLYLRLKSFQQLQNTR